MRILTNIMAFIVGALLAFGIAVAYAGDTMLACPQDNGTVMFTNKDVKGCKVVVGPELSVVPDRKASLATNHSDVVIEVPPITSTNTPSRFNAGDPGAILQETCTLWKEWMDLNKRTAGGFENMSVDETKKRFLLSRVFASMGFSPYGCQ